MDYLLMFAVGLCPLSFLIGAGMAVIIMLQLRPRKTWWHHTVTVKPRDWEITVRPLLDEGWHVDGVTPADINGFVDVHMRRYM